MYVCISRYPTTIEGALIQGYGRLPNVLSK